MHLDWSVNVPELVALAAMAVGAVWRVARLSLLVETLSERFGEHTAEDDKKFDSLADQLHRTQIDVAALQTHGRR